MAVRILGIVAEPKTGSEFVCRGIRDVQGIYDFRKVALSNMLEAVESTHACLVRDTYVVVADSRIRWPSIVFRADPYTDHSRRI
jgi:hypothetical protein